MQAAVFSNHLTVIRWLIWARKWFFWQTQFTSNNLIYVNFLGKQGKKLLTFTSLRLQIKESIKTLVMKFLSEFVSENAKFWKVEIFLRTQSLIAQLKQFSTTSHLNFVFGQAEGHYQLTDKFTTNWSLALCEILDWTRQIKRSIQHSIVCLT